MEQALQALLAQHGVEVLELPDDTGTAELAAAAVNAPVGTIVKSLVCLVDGTPVMALVAGDRRLDLTALARAVGGVEARMASAREAKEITGFAIGGVPPLGHARRLDTYLDRALLHYPTVYAAAGSRYRILAVSPQKLLDLTAATVFDADSGASAVGNMA